MTTYHLPDLSGPVQILQTYGAKSYVEANGITVVIATKDLVEAVPATVPSDVEGFQIGARQGGVR